MKTTWKLPADFLRPDERLEVALVGVGGTGSELLSNLVHLHLGLQALGHGGLHVVAFDPDVVSQANVVRQRYAPSDIGRNKACTLIDRINYVYSLSWHAMPTRFNSAEAKQKWDIVISCVDSRRARKQLHTWSHRSGFRTIRLWLDSGNDSTTGQVILGTPWADGKPLVHHLPCATELHPELMDDSVVEDAPSCSALEALQRQDLFINKMVALQASDMLWQLFRTGELEHHARYFDLRTCAIATRRVPAKHKKRAA